MISAVEFEGRNASKFLSWFSGLQDSTLGLFETSVQIREVTTKGGESFQLVFFQDFLNAFSIP